MLLVGSIFPGLIVVAAIVHGPHYIETPEDVLGLAAMIAIGVFFWLYFETSCYVLEDGFLCERKFGLTLWKIRSDQAEVKEFQENGFTYWIVSSRETHKRIGKVYCAQFYPGDLQRLLNTLFSKAVQM